MKNPLLRIILCSYLLFFGFAVIISAQTVSSFSKESDGALCVLSNNAHLKLQVCSDNIIRVVYTMGTTIPDSKSLVVNRTSFTPGTWDATENASAVTVTTPKVTATINKSNGLISFAASGKTICTESARTLTAANKGGTAGYSGTLKFNSPTDEAVYGLGNLSLATGGWQGSSYWDNYKVAPDSTGQLNIRSFTVDMHQANWMDVIPFFMTTSGYGVLMNFCCHAKKEPPLNFTADFLLNGSWDYYFVYGPQFDSIISGYRYITGPAPLPPKWAFGLWQCKNRYTSANDLTTAVQTFRSQNIPVDCIVQDWMWWAGGATGRGSFTWDPQFANPQNWIKTLHDSNCRFALSIWPTFSSGTANYSAMQPHLITSVACNGTNTDPGIFMNAFDTTGMRMFWGYMKSSALDNGVDAWWMDATEPECSLLTGFNTSLGVSDLYANSYAMMHAKNIYERQRAVTTDKRVVNLTRSFWAGQQRYGTLYWNGDISSADIRNIATTVSGGINSCMAGNPYWCSDIGGFTDVPADDILIRWFQAGTFFPIFRIHGSRNTEIYNMSATARPIATAFCKLRYRLLPYIYSLAWKVTNEGYTMSRALPFDFPDDASVRNIADQFMFGPAMLVNPILTTGSSRSVYLPAGTWYDFWNGDANNGTSGRNVTWSGTMQRIPIYVRAGSILPMGPNIQYANQSVDPIELRIYPGADGSFNLYEDQGDGYGYESGSYSVIPISYTGGKVTIGQRTGSFPGMLANRTFNVVMVGNGKGVDTTVTTSPDCVIHYSGEPITGCPVAIGSSEWMTQNHMRLVSPKTFRTTTDRITLPAAYVNGSNEVSVFDASGKLLRTKVVKDRSSLSLSKDFSLPLGVYVVKVKVAL